MNSLKKNWKIVAIAVVVTFSVGVGSLFYFRDGGGKFGSVESFVSGGGNEISVENVNGNNGVNDKNINTNADNNSNYANGSAEEIYIHIIGEVVNQGVITLSKGQRIIDAIEKAGGATEFADLSRVNLAYVLSDGQKVYIPNINSNINLNEEYVTTGGGYNVIQGGSGGLPSKVNINTASQTELETISGVGPSLAARIIDYREKNGKFRRVEELKNVSGIGDAKFEGIKDLVDV